MLRKALLTLLALVLAAVAGAQAYRARVIDVPTGDSLVVERRLGGIVETVTVRLYGIAAPRLGKPYGKEARRVLTELAFRKDVSVDTRLIDKYNRGIAVVTIKDDGTQINRSLLEQGLAWWYTRYAPNDRDLERAERQARAAHRGLWKQPRPEAPWQ